MPRWQVVQHELLPELQAGGLTPKLERLIHVLDWVRIEELVKDSWCGAGRFAAWAGLAGERSPRRC